jgi:hypothetical protein
VLQNLLDPAVLQNLLPTEDGTNGDQSQHDTDAEDNDAETEDNVKSHKHG